MNESQKTHLDFLKHSIYKIDTKWPQFKIMFDALENEADFIKSCQDVLIMERCYFYGGYSMFKPLFNNPNVQVVDCVNESTNVRKVGQESWIDHPEFIKTKADVISDLSQLSTELNKKFDLIFIPNIVHHIKDQFNLFRQVSELLNPGGKVLIFEGLVRELHHLPADYLRYTPFGVEHMFQTNNMVMEKYEHGSGVFDVIAYVMQMALEYFPEDEREKYSEMYEKVFYPKLQELDKKYSKNIQKPDKSFPMSYIVWGKK